MTNPAHLKPLTGDKSVEAPLFNSSPETILNFHSRPWRQGLTGKSQEKDEMTKLTAAFIGALIAMTIYTAWTLWTVL